MSAVFGFPEHILSYFMIVRAFCVLLQSFYKSVSLVVTL